MGGWIPCQGVWWRVTGSLDQAVLGLIWSKLWTGQELRVTCYLKATVVIVAYPDSALYQLILMTSQNVPSRALSRASSDCFNTLKFS